MQYPDVGYTNGVIAVREKHLLKDKLLRLCELSAEEAFRALLDSGFGGGAEISSSVYDYEKLITEEENRIDKFIFEYAPSLTEKAYLLSARDFHNAKAFVKAKFLKTDAKRMLAPDGLIDKEVLFDCIENEKVGKIREINPSLAEAIITALSLPEEEIAGTKIGEIFENGLYRCLFTVVKHKPILKKLLTAKVDMTNIITAFRAENKEKARQNYLPFGNIKEKDLQILFSDQDKIKAYYAQSPYRKIVESCLHAKEKNLPLTEAEKLRDSYDAWYFAQRKYDLEKTEPFLYYVYRRLAETSNVRILFVCLLAGVSEAEIKKRLRVW